MDPLYEAETVRHLAKLFKSGSVTRKLKVVHWSYGARTALAEAEVEYADRTSPAITVAFPVAEAEARRLDLPVPLFVPIWTTTPWTLPSNLAVAMHPDFEYAVARAGNLHYIVAVPLRDDFASKLGVELHTVQIRRGKEFQTLVARHPWINRESPVLLADYVTADTGTGLVHTAPDHGVDDFNLAHHLGLLQLVGPDGKFLPTVNDPELEGKNIFDCNPLVVGRLRRNPMPYLLAVAMAPFARRVPDAQLSPLLADQDTHPLPRHRAMVHHHGYGADREGPDAARVGYRGGRADPVDPCPGPEPHPGHDPPRR